MIENNNLMINLQVIETESEFDKKIKENKKVVVYFFADWCPPCKKIKPIFERIASLEKNIYFLKINTDELDNLAKKYNITSIPTIILFKNGEELLFFNDNNNSARITGYKNEEVLRNFISKIN